MAFKFPFTNYHELNLTWVLEQLKKLFEESEENVQTIETYDDRLSAVETEVTDLESTTTQAINTANAAATNAATALSRANTANENALTAGSQAGAAVTAAQGALQEAQAATQAAQQAQATAMTFDGRITQAQNDASAAVHEAESFENRVNAAINTANNAANTATIAQGIAVNANQTAAQALDELNAQRDELESIAAGLIDDINDEADAEKQEIQNLADSVIASIPSDYTQLSADVKNKAPLIVANASGDVVSFKDGADDMEIRHLLATINPIQAGTGEPSPSNVRAISGWTGLEGLTCGKNLLNPADASLATNNVRYINKNYLLKQGVTYKLCSVVPVTGLYIMDTNNEDIFWIYNSQELTYTPTKDIYVHFNAYWTSSALPSGGLSGNLIYLSIGINEGYEPYQGTSISVSWQSEAGTVYGGTLDIITGVLTVINGYVDMGSLNWIYEANFTRYRATLSGLNPNSEYMLSSIYKYSREPLIDHNIDNCICGYNYGGAPTVFLTNFSYTDAETFKTAMAGVPLVYTLATPQTVQLDPVTVKTLLGYNNIFTDCGPVSVDYPADTKLYIDGKFAELQALVLEN